MKMGRLIGILSILLQRERVTAQGAGGGISIMEPYYLVCVGLVPKSGGFPPVQTEPHDGPDLEPEELREQLGELTETLSHRYRRDQHGIP